MGDREPKEESVVCCEIQLGMLVHILIVKNWR